MGTGYLSRVLNQRQRLTGVVSYLHHLGAACQEVLDPVAQGRVQTQGPELNDELSGKVEVICSLTSQST